MRNAFSRLVSIHLFVSNRNKSVQPSIKTFTVHLRKENHNLEGNT